MCLFPLWAMDAESSSLNAANFRCSLTTSYSHSKVSIAGEPWLHDMKTTNSRKVFEKGSNETP
jgi:hypothetical protein